MRYITWASVPFYIGAIVFANIITAHEPPLVFSWIGVDWTIPWGTFFIAVTFFLRDAVQLAFGRRRAYYAIGVALLTTIILSRWSFHDLAWVTAASGLSFAVSETLDTEVFTRLHSRLGARIAVSGVIGGTIDSALFVVIGLSPLTTGIIPWSAVWAAIVAQVVIKCATNIGVGIPFARVSMSRAQAEAQAMA